VSSGGVITHQHVVLVEGKDEAYFLAELVKRRNLPEVQFLPYNGKDRLASLLHTLPKLPNFHIIRGLAITRDADRDSDGALQSVKSALKKAGLPVPSAELTPTSGSPVTAVLIVPGQGRLGMFEDCLLESVATNEAIPIVEEFILRIEAVRHSSLSERSKAKTRSFMAAQEPSYDLIGVCAKAGIWPLDHSAFDCFERLIRVTSPP
jgi:hypothetical protein